MVHITIIWFCQGAEVSLPRMYIHMIAEYARHAGHAALTGNVPVDVRACERDSGPRSTRRNITVSGG